MTRNKLDLESFLLKLMIKLTYIMTSEYSSLIRKSTIFSLLYKSIIELIDKKVLKRDKDNNIVFKLKIIKLINRSISEINSQYVDFYEKTTINNYFLKSKVPLALILQSL